MSGTDETELNRIREEYGDLMNEEDKEHFPTAQEQAAKRVEERREREKQEERARFISELFYHGQSFQRWHLYFVIFLIGIQLSRARPSAESVGGVDLLLCFCALAIIIFRRIKKFEEHSSRDSYIYLTALTCLWCFYAIFKDGDSLLFAFILAFGVPLCVLFQMGKYLREDDKPRNSSDNGVIEESINKTVLILPLVLR